MLTRKEKDQIRLYYKHYHAMRFLKDNTVMAQKSKGGAWGLLYSPSDTEKHLKAIREVPK